MSFLAVPAFELERAVGVAKAPRDWQAEGDLSLWLMRVLTSGLLFVGSVFLVGRLGSASLRARAQRRPRSSASRRWRRRSRRPSSSTTPRGRSRSPALRVRWLGRSRKSGSCSAGLCAGTAVLFQYATGLIALALLVYCGRRAPWFLLGAAAAGDRARCLQLGRVRLALPPSYRYVANPFAERQHHGFFGIGVPTLHGLREVLVGNRGLLVFSPVLLAAAVGLWLLWRRGDRAEALLAAAVSLLFCLLSAGYFLPYGGGSPGPRFFGPRAAVSRARPAVRPRALPLADRRARPRHRPRR